MARKKRHEEHENHERWLVSYADFITLLFAFFTSMYAISSVNEGKFRVLSESLSIAFNPSLHTATIMKEGPLFVREQRSHLMDEFQDMWSDDYQRTLKALEQLDSDNKLTLIVDKKKIVIRISESTVFKPATDELLDESYPVLDEIAYALDGIPNFIRVEGHTDDIPINTPRFPSNWDLSSARAITILKYLVGEHGFDPNKLSAVGYGEYRPVTDNDTPSGRAKNRRVDILVLNGADESGGY